MLFDASFFHLFFHEFLFLFLYRISLLFCFEGIEIFFYFVGTHDEHHLPNQGPIPFPGLFSRFLLKQKTCATKLYRFLEKPFSFRNFSVQTKALSQKMITQSFVIS